MIIKEDFKDNNTFSNWQRYDELDNLLEPVQDINSELKINLDYVYRRMNTNNDIPKDFNDYNELLESITNMRDKCIEFITDFKDFAKKYYGVDKK